MKLDLETKDDLIYNIAVLIEKLDKISEDDKNMSIENKILISKARENLLFAKHNIVYTEIDSFDTGIHQIWKM